MGVSSYKGNENLGPGSYLDVDKNSKTGLTKPP